MGATLVFEVGVEELPVSFLDRALDALPDLAQARLAAARLRHGAIRGIGTPRRITLVVEDLAGVQDDLAEEVLGPPTRIAVGDDGSLTKAGLGFAKKQGVDPGDIRTIETPKGTYVGFDRREAGKEATEVLPALLAELTSAIPFPKSMRWGPGDIAFGRPVHWIVALHGDAVVDVAFAGVSAGATSRGHRFLAPGDVEIPSADGYEGALAAAHVVVDPARRIEAVRSQLEAHAAAIGGRVVPDEFLVNECASLVEEPFVVPGTFDDDFLSLPRDLVITVMRDHQRYFAVEGPDGALAPRYLNVVNTANAPETIAQGNDRVLRARLADARFFVGEDRKRPLEERVPALDDVVFQAKLGSIGDKVRRVEATAPGLVTDDALSAQVREAAHLSKADLVTLTVGEFPELEGEIGRSYALADGIAPRVADAIRDHHRPRGAADAVPDDLVGACVALTDRVDTLVGCFGIGLVPSGSADPYALRRAALGIIRIARETEVPVDLRDLVEHAHAAYGDPSGSPLAALPEVAASLDDFFRARLRASYADEHPGDLIEACLAAWDGRSVRDLDARVAAVAAFRSHPSASSLAVAFKRTFNIAGDFDDPSPPDPTAYVDDAERALGERFDALRAEVEASIAEGDYATALARIADELREPIDRFFDEVLVMAEDAGLRRNRLRLVASIARMLTGIAHFDLISTRSPDAADDA